MGYDVDLIWIYLTTLMLLFTFLFVIAPEVLHSHIFWQLDNIDKSRLDKKFLEKKMNISNNYWNMTWTAATTAPALGVSQGLWHHLQVRWPIQRQETCGKVVCKGSLARNWTCDFIFGSGAAAEVEKFQKRNNGGLQNTNHNGQTRKTYLNLFYTIGSWKTRHIKLIRCSMNVTTMVPFKLRKCKVLSFSFKVVGVDLKFRLQVPTTSRVRTWASTAVARHRSQTKHRHWDFLSRVGWSFSPVQNIVQNIEEHVTFFFLICWLIRVPIFKDPGARRQQMRLRRQLLSHPMPSVNAWRGTVWCMPCFELGDSRWKSWMFCQAMEWFDRKS